MDRAWYIRFVVVVGLFAWAALAIWPSVDEWIPAPAWVKETFTGRISPGLDIQGGLRLVYEVDVDGAVENHRDRLADKLVPSVGELIGVLTEDEADAPSRENLDEVHARVRVQSLGQRRIRLTFDQASDAEKLDREWLREGAFADLAISSADGAVVNLAIREDRVEQIKADSVDQAVKAIENRVDELAIREMTVIGRDTDIIIEIPGGDDTSRVVSTVVAMAAIVDPDSEGRITVEVSDSDLAERSGIPEGAVRDVFRRLGRGERPFATRDGDRIVIADLERFRMQSTFEKIRSIIRRQARLEFKVLEDESTFIAGLTNLPEGITTATERSTIAEGRNVTSTYLVARGEGSRLKLLEYVAGLEVPDGREILVGSLDAADDEEAQGGQEAWRTYFLYAATEVTGEHVEDAYVGNDEQGRPVVQLEFNSDGASSFGRMTGANVKRRMAIVLDSRVESAPVIQERIGGGRCQITLGSYRDYEALTREASELVVVLKAGALPADINPSNEQLIGPTLGKDSITRGAEGAVVGVGLVLIFMLFYYQVAGIVADLMVVLNLLLLMATLAFFEATLTLPGVAGIALTVGMAVDANVLITERIREELRLGKSPRAAVDQGFRRAFWSIFDAQLTTFIAGVVLFQYGTGPIKGFAVTLMIGIATSLFTGVFCSKVLLDWVVRGLRVQRLRVG